jgi:hypothetical protein
MGGILLDAGSSRIGWHRHGAFLRCHQLYAYTHELRMHFEESPPLIRGSLIHIGMAHYWTRKSLAEMGPMQIQLRDGSIVKLTHPDEVMPPSEAIEALAMQQPWRASWLRWAPLAQDALAAYEVEQVVAQERLKVVGVEIELLCQIHGFDYSQRADLIVEDEFGKIWIWDHKHTAVLSEDTIDGFSIDGQFLGLFWLGRAFYGERFAGVWANMVDIGRAGTKGRGTFKFQRMPISPAVPLLRQFPDNVKEVREEIERLRASGRDPWQWRKAMNQMTCIHRYGKCEAWDLCHGRKT